MIIALLDGWGNLLGYKGEYATWTLILITSVWGYHLKISAEKKNINMEFLSLSILYVFIFNEFH